MKLSVIIPTKNESVMLREILSQLDSSDAEVLVIDAHSQDGSEFVAREFGARYLTCEGDLSAAKNFGAQVAQGEWLFFLDADQKLWSATPLQDLLVWLDSHRCDACTGPIRQAEGTEGIVSQVRESLRMVGVVLSGGYTVIKRDVFWRLGGFRPREVCLGTWEDLDLSARCALGGYKMLQMPFKVVHKRPFQYRWIDGTVIFKT